MKKCLTRALIVFVSVAMASLSSVATGFAQTPATQVASLSQQLTVVVHKEVVTTRSFEDQNWPIISTETHQQLDAASGQLETELMVVRKGPKALHSIVCPNQVGNSASVGAADTCVYNYPESYTHQITIGGVTGYVKHFAYNYCSGVDCGFVQIYELDVWWDRTNTNQTVINANTYWGCNGSCALCPNLDPYTYLFHDGPFTPGWNGLASNITKYTSTPWPVMKTTGAGTVTGGNVSTVNGSQQLSVYMNY